MNCIIDPSKYHNSTCNVIQIPILLLQFGRAFAVPEWVTVTGLALLCGRRQALFHSSWHFISKLHQTPSISHHTMVLLVKIRWQLLENVTLSSCVSLVGLSQDVLKALVPRDCENGTTAFACHRLLILSAILVKPDSLNCSHTRDLVNPLNLLSQTFRKLPCFYLPLTCVKQYDNGYLGCTFWFGETSTKSSQPWAEMFLEISPPHHIICRWQIDLCSLQQTNSETVQLKSAMPYGKSIWAARWPMQKKRFVPYIEKLRIERLVFMGI